MGTKKLLYCFNRPPHGSLFWTEGIRAAVGAVAGIDNHKVTILYQGDGVYNTLKEIEAKENEGYLVTLKEEDTKFYVIEEDLKERGISQDELLDYIKPISRKEAFQLYKEADFILDW